MKKKRILGICGSTKKGIFSSSEFLLREALNAAELGGAETKLVRLVDYNILTCRGCGMCMANTKCSLLDDPKDQLSELYDECVKADGFIFSSPVYALAYPAIWKNWIDRCEPCDEKDLSYEFYCYDVVQDVKGKAFKGKVAGQIAVAAGPGHEWAMASMMPAFTAIRLSVVASVGISLIEYDHQPGIKTKHWAKDIRQADFAIDMARSVGRRVCETIGYSTFKMDSANRAVVYHDNPDFKDIGISGMKLENAVGETVDIHGFENKKVIFIAAGQRASNEAKMWLSKLQDSLSGKYDIRLFNIAVIGKLPHFISRNFIKKQVSNNIKNFSCLFDWDMEFAGKYGIADNDTASILLADTEKEVIKFMKSFKYNDDNWKTVINEINKYV